jgi:hypothetical protein
VRQRQEQTHRRAQHHVHLEQPAGAPKFIYIYIRASRNLTKQ